MFKNYKKLYETELSNRKMFEQRYKELKQENIELQKSTGLAKLRKQLQEIAKELAFVKEDRARLYVQLEDLRNESEMKKGGK